MKYLTPYRKKQPGFTIVELLIVIVVIAILAAITIVAYNGIQQRARATEASAALSQAKKKLELYKVDNSAYPTSGNLSAAGVTDGDVTFQYTSDGTTYCITGTATNVSYKATDTTSPTAGGCAGHGQGGVAAITNMAANPSFEVNTSGWGLNTPGFSGTGSGAVTSGGYSGTKSYRYTASSSGTIGSFGMFTTLTNVSATASYTLSAYVRSSDAIGYKIGAEKRDNANTLLGVNYSTPVTLTPNTWTRLTLTLAPTATMTKLTLVIYSQNGTLNAGSTIDFDAAMITESSNTYNYADGNSTNWAWNGTANNSTSTGPPL